MSRTILLVAIKDIASNPQCAFRISKGETIRVDKKDWDAKRCVYNIVTGHGTSSAIRGLREVVVEGKT